MVRHIASQTSIKLSGPDASAETPSTSAPPGEHPQFSAENPATLSETETDLEDRLEAEKNAAGPPATANVDVGGEGVREGEASFEDSLSVVFGPVGEGRRVRGVLAETRAAHPLPPPALLPFSISRRQFNFEAQKGERH